MRVWIDKSTMGTAEAGKFIINHMRIQFTLLSFVHEDDEEKMHPKHCLISSKLQRFSVRSVHYLVQFGFGFLTPVNQICQFIKL